jgi:4-amino-4-deoxy-L-arabinose transferase-like glycosyltransferase
MITAIFSLIFLNLLLWNIFIPIFELPSEQLYFGRMQYIAATQSLPDMRTRPSGDLIYPDTYPLLMVPIIALLQPPAIQNQTTLKINQQTITLASLQRGTYNRFVHPASEKQFHWTNLEWSVHLIRFFTSIFSFISIILIFKTTQRLFGATSYLPHAILLFTGFQPKFIHRSASIINIPLLLFAFSLFFYWALTHKPSLKTSFLLGIATGLALITKVTGLNLILFFGLYLLLFVTAWRQRLIYTLSFMGGTLVTGGWNLLRNFILYQDPLALNQAFRIAADLHPKSVIPLFGSWANYWFGVFETTFITFWDGFGWETIQFGRLIHYGLLLLIIFSITGFVKSKINKNLLFLSLTLVIFTAAFIKVNTQFFTPQGKDFFPMILPISLVLVLGLNYWYRKLLPQLKFKPLPVAVSLFIFNLLILFFFVVPATLGNRNISESEYYRLTSDPIKQFFNYYF